MIRNVARTVKLCTLPEHKNKWISEEIKIKATGQRGSAQSYTHNVSLGFCQETKTGWLFQRRKFNSKELLTKRRKRSYHGRSNRRKQPHRRLEEQKEEAELITTRWLEEAPGEGSSEKEVIIS